MPARSRFRTLLLALLLPAALPAARAEDLRPVAPAPAPPLALDRLDGPALDLADFGGRPVIVHFFATWCAPCIAEMAALGRLAAVGDPPITILAVDVGEVEARLRGFFRDRPVHFPVLLDRDRVALKRWGVDSLPSSFVLDGRLRIVAESREPLDWTSPAIVQRLHAMAREPQDTTTPMGGKKP